MKLLFQSGNITGLCFLIAVLWLVFGSGQLKAQEDTETTFIIERVVVAGNTVLEKAELKAFRKAYEWQTMTLADAQEVAKALEEKYRSRGYLTTRVLIPPQSLADRTLMLWVMEGKAGTVSVEGDRYFGVDHNYRPYLPRQGDVLNVKELENSVKVLNSHPDKEGRVFLAKGEVEGTTDILLKVREQRPLHFGLGLNNTGTQNTPRLRSVGTLQYDDFFDRSQAGVFQYTTAPEDTDAVRQYAASYSIPLGPLGGPVGHSVTAYAALSESETETILDLIRLEGKGSVLGAQYSFPLPEVLSFEQRLSVGLEWQKVEHITGFGAARFEQEVRKLPLVARWNAVRPDKHGVTGLSVGLRWQRDGLFCDFDEQAYEAVRTDADEDFWSAVIGVQRQHVLGAGWTCSVSCQGQIAGDRLLPSEQYGLGGYNTVRGYRYRTIAADEALNIRTELVTPALRQFLPEGVNESIRFLAFFDGAWARNRDAAVGELDDERMTGVGVGMRASFFDSVFTGRVDAGWAMDDLESTVEDERGELIVHFGIQCSF